MSSISPPIPEHLTRAYSILEVRPMCTSEEVRAAYLDLVKIWHPDRHQTEPERLRRKAEDKLKEIVDAYEIIQKHGEMAEDVPLIAMDFGEFWGYIDHQGKTAIHPEFSQARGFVRGLAAVQSIENGGLSTRTAIGASIRSTKIVQTLPKVWLLCAGMAGGALSILRALLRSRHATRRPAILQMVGPMCGLALAGAR